MAEVALKRAEMRGIVQGLTAAGGTNFYAGLEAGYQEVLRNYDSGRQNRVILLSDGEPTSGVTDEAAIVAMSRGYNSDGVGLTTIGLGTSFNAPLMRSLALQADGNFYFLENSGAVSEVFSEELSFFTVPIAFDLKLSLRTGDQYAFGAAHGSPFWRDTSYGGTLEVPSVFLAHRQSHDDVTDQGGRRGGGSALIVEVMPKLTSDDGSGTSRAEVAVIDVSYREPGSNAIVEDQVTVTYPFAPWLTPETGFFLSPDVAIVQKGFVMLNVYAGIERACGAFHGAGGGLPSPAEAVTELDRLIAAVDDYNEEIADTDIEYDLELLRELRRVMLLHVAPPAPTPLPSNPWPAD
jgi:Ca-activated chloride channel family protein